MQITIDLHLIINGSRTTIAGHFQLRAVNEIPTFAYNWIKRVRRETGYRAIIEKVIYNGDNDITEVVKAIDNAPIPDIPYTW